MQIFSQINVTSPYRRGIPFGNRGIKVKHCKWFTFTQQFIQRPITLNDSMELRTTMAWLRFLSHRMNSASECIYIRENRDHAHMTYMGSLQFSRFHPEFQDSTRNFEIPPGISKIHVDFQDSTWNFRKTMWIFEIPGGILKFRVESRKNRVDF